VGVAAPSETWRVGTWAPGAGNGILSSTDSGATDTKVNWPLEAEARYGSFPDGNLETAFLSGGDFPSTEIEVPPHYSVVPITHKKSFVFSHDKKAFRVIRHKKAIPRKAAFNKEAPPPPPVTPSWWAAFSKTFDGGKTWTTLINQTWLSANEGYYFNQISFVGDNNGWIVGQGQYENGTSFGQIIATTNGGTNWTTQLNLVNGEFMAIQMTSATTGWVAGGYTPNGRGFPEAVFYYTSDGQTWTQTGGTLKDFDVIDMSVGVNSVYAVGASELGICNVAKFSF